MLLEITLDSYLRSSNKLLVYEHNIGVRDQLIDLIFRLKSEPKACKIRSQNRIIKIEFSKGFDLKSVRATF